ncbi:type II toxin-antitoxin system RelE/ParE family toxin [Candidatus Micrarchaeota archaeon]|nr:type II toxin-antitoxin system RelE/ParE family toxin [Candidatus Micrarchaeota archaeon]
MAYYVEWSPRARQVLRSMEKDLAERIASKVMDIQFAPYHFVEKLIGENAWRMRVGDYRVILDINEPEKKIEVLELGHRKNIYKK